MMKQLSHCINRMDTSSVHGDAPNPLPRPAGHVVRSSAYAHAQACIPHLDAAVTSTIEPLGRLAGLYIVLLLG
jgi:hypothetical protein